MTHRNCLYMLGNQTTIQMMSFVIETEDGKLIVIDGGKPGDAQHLLDTLRRLSGEEKPHVNAWFLTHNHIDHTGALETLRWQTGAKVYVHRLDGELLTDANKNASAYFVHPVVTEPADILLAEGDAIDLDGETLTVIHTPGHTPGGVCYRGETVLFTGDTLFAGSVGRSDFWGGDEAQLLRSIREKLLPLTGLKVYPGQGDETSIEKERRENPWLAEW